MTLHSFILTISQNVVNEINEDGYLPFVQIIMIIMQHQ